MLDGKTGEVAQHYNSRFASVEGLEPGQRFVKRQQFIALCRVVWGRGDGVVVQIHARAVTPSFVTAASSCPLDENATHRNSSRTKEVPATVPCRAVCPLGPQQPHVRLVYQCCRLQRVAGAASRFVAHVAGRKLAQFVVNKRQEFRRRMRIAFGGVVDQECDVLAIVAGHATSIPELTRPVSSRAGGLSRTEGVMLQFILAIISLLIGMLASLCMLVLMMAGLANANEAHLRQGKWMMWGIVVVQLLALIAAIWLMVQRKHMVASVAGFVPVVVVVALLVILVKIEW